METPRSPLLFLSHAGVDTERAIAIARQVEAAPAAKEAGLRVWVDKRPDGDARLQAGHSWPEQLEKAIASHSTAFAVLLTREGVRNWVRMEVRAALNRVVAEQRVGRTYPFIPIIDGDSGDLASLPAFAQLYHGVQFGAEDQGLADLVRAALGLGNAPLALVDDPFRGLEAFESDHAALFFGREPETLDLIQRLKHTELLLITGDSGSGKSSLVKAGLIPAYREACLADPMRVRPDSSLWHVIQMRPGIDPFEGLLQGALDAGRKAGIAETTLLAIGDRNLGVRSQLVERVRDALQLARPGKSKLLLVVDQFEELWTTVRDGDKRNAFIDVLLALVPPGDPNHHVVATLRRDFFHLHSDHDGLRSRLIQNPEARFVLGPMSAQAVGDIVVKPLHLAGVTGSDPEALAAAILQDTQNEPGNLALVQMALYETWQRRNAHNSLLHTYNHIGRLEGALASAATDVYWNVELNPTWLDDVERPLGEALFMRLARLGNPGRATRRTVRLNEVDASTQAVATKLTSKSCRRLLVASGKGVDAVDDGAITVELAHEQLLTQWPDYRHWLWGAATSRWPADPQRETDKRLLDRLMDRSVLWTTRGKGEADLAPPVDIEEYAGLKARRSNWLSQVELEFIDASIQSQGARYRQQARAIERERVQLDLIHSEQSRRARTLRRASGLIAVSFLLTAGASLLAVKGFQALHWERSHFLLTTAETLANQGELESALRVALLGSAGSWLKPQSTQVKEIFAN